jgi:hypothetical protein
MFLTKTLAPSRESRGFSTACKSACNLAGRFAGSVKKKQRANLTKLNNLTNLTKLDG